MQHQHRHTYRRCKKFTFNVREPNPTDAQLRASPSFCLARCRIHRAKKRWPPPSSLSRPRDGLAPPASNPRRVPLPLGTARTPEVNGARPAREWNEFRHFAVNQP
jgi:hypothetical protein